MNYLMPEEPLPPNLPLLKGDGGVGKYKGFKPLASQERGWGEVKFWAIALTLNYLMLEESEIR
jgi:hypothetical protein